MTPDELQAVADGWAARAIQSIDNGEREAAAVYAECAGTLARYLPAKAPEPAPKAVEAPKPVNVAAPPVDAVEEPAKPKRPWKMPKGV